MNKTPLHVLITLAPVQTQCRLLFKVYISVKGSHHILLLPINWFLIMVMRRLPFGDSELTASVGALRSLGYAVGR